VEKLLRLSVPSARRETIMRLKVFALIDLPPATDRQMKKINPALTVNLAVSCEY